ncbi:MAG: TonB-dependent receptor domain-containing protein [Fidelibacterota bacterium]
MKSPLTFSDSLQKTRSLIYLLMFCVGFAYSQNRFKVLVLDSQTNGPLPGANLYIKALETGTMTDSGGIAFLPNLPNGTYQMKISYIGYASQTISLTFPSLQRDTVRTITLNPESLSSNEVFVTTTRTNGIVDDIAVHVEVLGSEEVNEEIAIRPGNISKLLGETSGILVQQTSVTSGNTSFRIQGLPGKYTQLLKDGYPLYNGFSSGLSLLQIPPLDLLQVEVIKNSVSSLYGGDAIAGIINLISRKPRDRTQWSAIVNQTSQQGRDLSTYYSGRINRLGFTVLASRSTQDAYDGDRDGFTEEPRSKTITFAPKLFYDLGVASHLELGVTGTSDDRAGGDLIAVRKGADSVHTYLETNHSSRITTRLKLERELPGEGTLTFKSSLNRFRRRISINPNSFSGDQISSFNELSGLFSLSKHQIVAGLNYLTDQFTGGVSDNDGKFPGDYRYATVGIFGQDDWTLRPRFTLQTGLRLDHHNRYGTFFLPRLSAMFTPNIFIKSRLSLGSGYKIPTIITDESESRVYRNIRPVTQTRQAETSSGVSWDITYKIVRGDMLFSINQAFFITQIQHPWIPNPDSLNAGIILFQNAADPLVSKGFDTNVKFVLDEFDVFLDYSYDRVRKQYDPEQPDFALTPRQKLNLTVTYEKEGNWRIGMEAFYTGKQRLDSGKETPDFWTLGLMSEKKFSHFSVIGNIENLLDVKQSRFGPLVDSSITPPIYAPLYAPLEGRVVNVAIKLDW